MSQMPPPPMPEPESWTQQSGQRPAELLDRFVARLIDGVILLAVNVVFTSVIVIGTIMGSSTGVTGGGSYVAALVYAVISTLIYVGYFAYLESSQGRTIGKMVMKLRVVGPEGGNPTLEQAARRNIWLAFGLLAVLPVVGSFLGSLGELIAAIVIAVQINSDTVARQGWHDRFAGGTRVVKEG